MRWDETQADTISPSLLYSIICLLGGPELFVLFASEALVIVAFAFEQLLEVRFAVKFTLESCKAAKAARKQVMKPLHTNQKTQETKKAES